MHELVFFYGSPKLSLHSKSKRLNNRLRPSAECSKNVRIFSGRVKKSLLNNLNQSSDFVISKQHQRAFNENRHYDDDSLCLDLNLTCCVHMSLLSQEIRVELLLSEPSPSDDAQLLTAREHFC